MSLDVLPAFPAPASVKVRPHQRTKSTQAMSGRILTNAYGGHFFEMTLVYHPMHRKDAGGLIAFLQYQRGRSGIFTVPLDQLTGLSGLQVGNFAKFNNDSKVHVITQTAPSVEVMPAARVAGGTLITTGVAMKCSLTRDAQEITLGTDGLIRLELDLIERV
ncbi:hypothetical protein [Kordiimonas sp.]|uniref:hypothetical protein n=1 Tax=Kordiimonas sp. TaxID=1970157 RepID=UPI003A8FF893